MVRQRLWLDMVIRALNAGAADTKHCCHALLPTRVIAGHGATTPRAATAMERAPWIRIRRLRVANLHFAQQRNGNDKKRNDQHTHGCLPIVVFICVACYQFAEMLECALAADCVGFLWPGEQEGPNWPAFAHPAGCGLRRRCGVNFRQRPDFYQSAIGRTS